MLARGHVDERLVYERFFYALGCTHHPTSEFVRNGRLAGSDMSQARPPRHSVVCNYAVFVEWTIISYRYMRGEVRTVVSLFCFE